MEQSHVVGWGLESPTPAQLKEFFAQIESGRITKEHMQAILSAKSVPMDSCLLSGKEDEKFPGIDSFAFNKERLREVRISSAGDGEMYDLLDKKETNIPERTIGYHTLERDAFGREIFNELGFNAEMSLFHVFSVIKRKIEGSSNLLLADGSNVNLFFVEDTRGGTRTLAVERRVRYAGFWWVVHTYLGAGSSVWLRGYRVISYR